MKRRAFLAAATAAALTFGYVVPVFAVGEPTVGTITPTTASVNAATTVTASYNDPDGVANCHLFVDGVDVGDMTLSGGPNSTSGSATFGHSFGTSGGSRAQVRCVDRNGNYGVSEMTGVTVGPMTPPAPVVGAATMSGTVVAGAEASFDATYSDTDNVRDCTLVVNGDYGTAVNVSAGTIGSVNTKHTFGSPGSYDVQVRCTDAEGNVGHGPVTTIYVQPTDSTSAPTLGNFTNLSGTVGQPVSFSATYNDTDGINSCRLYVDNAESTGEVTVSGGVGTVSGDVTASRTFTEPGMHSAYLRCTDTGGNAVIGATSYFNVFAAAGSGTDTGTGTDTNTGTGTDTNDDTDTSDETTEPIITVTGAVTLEQMNSDALFVSNAGTRAEFETTSGGTTCEWEAADATSKVNASIVGITDTTQRAAIENFAACGTGTSMKLGAGERLGVVNSFRAAYGRLPTTQEDWFDVIKIGNGRFPSQTSATAETRAQAAFKLIYLRDADTSVTADNNAVTVMAYGLRPMPRNLNSEAAAVDTFRAVYKRAPSSAADWDIVRAVAYSGATR